MELKHGEVVNLGIGIPTLVADYLSPGLTVYLHTENGLLGAGPSPRPGEEDPHLVNASKQLITTLPGASFFDSATSFAMIRGGHVNVAIMGALQVSAKGDLANWKAPGGNQLGVGGAMDLVVGAQRVIVTMTHSARDGGSKLVPECTMPITALGEVDLVITELAVFRRVGNELMLEEIAPDTTLDQVRQLTLAPFRVREPLGKMRV